MLSGALGVGCGDVEPLPSHFADVGDEGRPLPPAIGQGFDSRVKTGSAEFKPFAAPASKDAKKESGEGGEPSEQVSSEEIEQEIRDLVAEHNKHVAEGKYDEVVDYYVPAQRESAKAMFDAGKQMIATIEELKKELIVKTPESKDQIESMVNRLVALSNSGIVLRSMKVVSPKEVQGDTPPMPGFPSAVTFRLIHDKEDDTEDWYIDSPALAEYEKLKPVFEAGAQQFTMLVNGVKSGAMPPAQVLPILEAAIKMGESMANPASEGTAKPDDAKPADPKKTEKDEE